MLWGFSVRNLGMKPTVCQLQTIYEEILQHESTASVTSIMYLTMWLFFFFPGVQHCADIPSVSTFQSSYSGWVKCKATSMSLNSFLPMLIFFTEMTPVIALSKVPKKKKKVPLGTEIHSSPWVAEPNPGNEIQKPKWYWNDELKEQNNHGCSRVKIKSYLLFPEGNELINSLTRNISLCFVTMCIISVTNSILSSCAMVEHIVPMISLHYRLKRRKVSVSEAWQVLQG